MEQLREQGGEHALTEAVTSPWSLLIAPGCARCVQLECRRWPSSTSRPVPRSHTPLARHATRMRSKTDAASWLGHDGGTEPLMEPLIKAATVSFGCMHQHAPHPQPRPVHAPACSCRNDAKRAGLHLCVQVPASSLLHAHARDPDTAPVAAVMAEYSHRVMVGWRMGSIACRSITGMGVLGLGRGSVSALCVSDCPASACCLGAQ